jgi:Flp pilus assembly pilin Flp
MVEWSLLAVAIALLLVIYVRKIQVVKGMAELAAVKSTLGALRTAQVIEHLRQNVKSEKSSTAFIQHNPFELLQRRPANYVGERTRVEVVSGAVPAGSWVFDVTRECVGYVPMGAQWLESPSGELIAWFSVTGWPGPLQLNANEAYVWQGEILN